MIAIKTYLRSDAKDKSYGYVWIKFYISGKKVNFSTKIQCLEKDWNPRTSRVLSSDKDSGDKNLIIKNFQSRIVNVIVKYRLKNKTLTREGFTKMFNRPDDYETFYQFCDDYLTEISNRTELSTLNTHKTAIEKLRLFAPELHFDDIDHNFIVNYFYSHLKKKLGNCDNTAYKNMTVLKKYVRAACKKGYMEENPFDDFKIKRTTSNYIYLEEDELKKLLTVYKTGNLSLKYYKSLQFFLYMCFSSQHIGDAKKMKIEQFGIDSFIYFRQKTRNSKPEPITVPISEVLKSLITDIAGHRKIGLLFDSLPADQTMNRFLKEIMKMEEVNIKKEVTHKTGRHTFATFYLDKTQRLNTLKDILGHSDIRETLIYAHVLEKSKKRSIECFDFFSDET